MTRLRSKVVLAAASTLATLLAVEVALRIKVHLEDRGLLDRSLDPGIKIPADGRVELGHIVRLSPHDDIIYELRPGVEASFLGAPLRIDERGFRRTSPRNIPGPSGSSESATRRCSGGGWQTRRPTCPG